MKTTCAIIIFSSLFTLAWSQSEKYTTKYDDMDLDEVLNNERLLHQYMKCSLDKGPCTKEMTVLKEIIPDALKTDCSKCSLKQKKAIKKVMKHMLSVENEFYKELSSKYDPQGIYKKKYADIAEKEGINLE